MRIGIVGHGADKFTDWSRRKARETIKHILNQYREDTELVVVSGRSPVGGIDIWAEEIAEEYGIKTDIKEPKQNQWDAEYGFKQRNIDIAKSDIVHVILVRDYPPNYKGRTFTGCYHCLKHPSVSCEHIKSGACWTGWKAKELGNKVKFHIIMDEFQVMEYWGEDE